MVAVLVLGAAACGESTPPLDRTIEYPGPVITVRQESYHWNTDREANILLENPHDVPVHAASCPPYWLQRWDNGWKTLNLPFGYPTGAAACAPRALAPADTFEYRVILNNDMIPVAGWYRLVLNLHRDGGGQNLWPEGNRASPHFFVQP